MRIVASGAVAAVTRGPDRGLRHVIHWLDVQCLTDAIHFYKVPVVAVCGHADLRPAKMVFIRVKQMLTVEHYRKIKKDFLRVHRQYVLGPDLAGSLRLHAADGRPTVRLGLCRDRLQQMPGL